VRERAIDHAAVAEADPIEDHPVRRESHPLDRDDEAESLVCFAYDAPLDLSRRPELHEEREDCEQHGEHDRRDDRDPTATHRPTSVVGMRAHASFARTPRRACREARTAFARASRSRRKKTEALWGDQRASKIRRRPTLPHTYACSTIGSGGLDYRVRDGIGYDPSDKATETERRCSSQLGEPAAYVLGSVLEIAPLFLRPGPCGRARWFIPPGSNIGQGDFPI
jgi:hypothetical protein